MVRCGWSWTDLIASKHTVAQVFASIEPAWRSGLMVALRTRDAVIAGVDKFTAAGCHRLTFVGYLRPRYDRR
jgi:lipoate synthase